LTLIDSFVVPPVLSATCTMNLTDVDGRARVRAQKLASSIEPAPVTDTLGT
jgi:hypothetical protein